MKNLWIIARKELRTYFTSPIAYVVMCFFLFLTGFAFYVGVLALNRGPSDVTVLQAFFNTLTDRTFMTDPRFSLPPEACPLP